MEMFSEHFLLLALTYLFYFTLHHVSACAQLQPCGHKGHLCVTDMKKHFHYT